MRKLLLLLLSIILMFITINATDVHAQTHTLLALQTGGSIALTFDDGPSAFTARILNVLQQNGVHATFFCIGQQVQTRPGIVREVSEAGNVIGNHSWSHADLTLLTPNQVTWQLSSTSTAILQATGISPTLFRPPYGAINAMVTGTAAQLGLSPVLWNIDTLDWTRPGVNAIVRSVLDHAINGSIVLMHDGGGDRSETIQALPQIISGLRQRGFAFVTATTYY
jgi:peptidoglycan/xylan/chitin deacetylase (PgdA/CDA1 family)